jgi:hypothetical protein
MIGLISGFIIIYEFGLKSPNFWSTSATFWDKVGNLSIGAAKFKFGSWLGGFIIDTGVWGIFYVLELIILLLGFIIEGLLIAVVWFIGVNDFGFCCNITSDADNRLSSWHWQVPILFILFILPNYEIFTFELLYLI